MRIPIQIQMTAGENGPAALAMILGYFGRYVPLYELREVCVTSRNGTSPEQMMEAARHYGLEAELKTLSIEELRSAQLPLMICWKKRYYAIITRFRGDLVEVADPAKGMYKCPMNAFKKNYTGKAIVLTKGSSFKPGGKRESLYVLLKDRIRSLRKPMFWLMIFSLLCIWLDMALSRGQKTLMDSVVSENGDLSVLSPITSLFGKPNPDRAFAAVFMMAVLLGGAVLYAVFTIIRDRIINRAARNMLAESGSSMFKHLFGQPLRFFEQYSAGELIQRLSGNEKLVHTLVSSLVPRIINAVMTVFYFWLMMSYNRIIALLCLVIEVVNSIILIRLQEQTAIISRSMATSTGALNSSVLNGMNMIDTIKSTGSEKAFFNMWYESQSQVNESRISTFRINQVIRAFSDVHNYLLQGIQMFLGAYFVAQGQFTLGSIAMFRSVLGNMRGSLNNVMSSVNTMQTMRTNIERVDDISRRPVRKEIPLEENKVYDKLPGEITVSHVSYRYNPGDEPAIDDVSLEVKPGQIVAIVGGTGCGKSTLLKLMADLYEPESGEIRYSGMKREEIPDVVFHSSVMTVDQETVVFEDSVYSNIRMWDSTIEDYEIYLAARDAQIHERIMRDPAGYGTQILENGQNFSGGELQRLELARALAHEPTVLFLDEFTSALDALTESKVIQAIRDKRTTCVIVAHRLSTIVDCDRIYVMDKGRIVQEGTHSELYKQEGLYRQLIGSA